MSVSLDFQKMTSLAADLPREIRGRRSELDLGAKGAHQPSMMSYLQPESVVDIAYMRTYMRESRHPPHVLLLVLAASLLGLVACSQVVGGRTVRKMRRSTSDTE